MDGRLIRARVDEKGAFFSFVYSGEHFPSLAGWKTADARKAEKDGMTVRTIVGFAPDGLLAVEIEVMEFPGTPVIEWLMRFRNGGRKDSAILEDVAPLDLAFPHAGTENPSLVHSFGCCDTGTGGVGFGTGIGNYLLSNDLLQNGTSLSLSNPGGGKTLFSVPFFNLVEKPGGLIGALGWPGRYLVEVSRNRDAEIRIRAGMEKTRVSLHPGESIRTPLVLLLPWEGDPADAHNALRRHILRHHAPRYEGQPVVLPLSHAGWGGMKTKTALDLVERTARDGVGYENFWMDAGWYGADREVDEFQVFNEEDWFLHAGNWRVNRVPHPGGLKPISDAAHAKGMKYLLWFEPERAVVGTPLTMEHPDWFIGEAATEFMGHSDRPYVRYRLFNFGNPEARTWMTDWMSRQIAELGIDIYRQDCNFALADFWQAADTPKRQGMSEIRYVEGLLEFWDELRRRHPKLILDITQRADLETISRGVDLTRSDYPIAPESDPIGNQAATMGLASWRPHFGTCFQAKPGDTYQFRSALCPGMSFSPFIVCGTRDQLAGFDTKSFPFDWARRMVEQFRQARPYYYGDYYPLTSCSLDRTQWAGYQMHRPDLREGMVLMLRRPESPFSAARFRLRGLDPRASYEARDADGGAAASWRPEVIAREGLEILIDDAPGSRLLFYREV